MKKYWWHLRKYTWLKLGDRLQNIEHFFRDKRMAAHRKGMPWS